MKTSELRKLIREEARKVIATSKNKSTKVNEGLVGKLTKSFPAQEIEAFATKGEADCALCKTYPKKDTDIKTALENNFGVTFDGTTVKVAKITSRKTGKVLNYEPALDKIKSKMAVTTDKMFYGALLLLQARGKVEDVIRGTAKAIYDKTKNLFTAPLGSLATGGSSGFGTANEESMEFALRKTIREIAKKEIAAKKRRLNEEVTEAELENMKATVGYIANKGPVYKLTPKGGYDEMVAEDATIVSFEEGSEKVLDYAKNHGGARHINNMVTKLEALEKMGTEFVL
jgi:hypothetical protein